MTTPLQPSTKDDILRYLLRKGQSSVQDLSEELDISPQAIRRHLKDLEAETLIVHQPVSSGMGRPQYVYQLSKAGRSYFPEAYDRFALDLLDTLVATVPPEQLQTILRQQWQRKGVEYHHRIGNLPLKQRVKVLVELRRSEGYMTDYYPADRTAKTPTGEPQGEDSNQWEGGDRSSACMNGNAVGYQTPSLAGTAEEAFIVTEYNCAIANVAESFPSICDYEMELFSTALGPDCCVERTHWMREGEHHCGYFIHSTSANEAN